MTRFAPLKRIFFSLFVIANCLFGLPVSASDPQTQMENKAFKEAVKAVKNRNYAHAITLFEAQAKMARHDAQHNLAVLLNAGGVFQMCGCSSATTAHRALPVCK